MRKWLLLAAAMSSQSLYGWGCAGHQIVALLAQRNLNAHAAAEVRALLKNNPIDPTLVRYCTQGLDDPMASAATWADDVRSTTGTAAWHYMDIPRQVTSGDPSRFCDAVLGPENKDRKGCVFTAIPYNRAIVSNSKAKPAERAEALRFLIHFVGDIHQPLHVTDNHDQGGNCITLSLLQNPIITNLHSAWDSGILEERPRMMNRRSAQYAESLDRKFKKQHATWAARQDLADWVWDIHAVGTASVYDPIRPAIPLAPVAGRTDCNTRKAETWAAHTHLDREYVEQAMPAIDVELAKAGFRLAAVLNDIWE